MKIRFNLWSLVTIIVLMGLVATGCGGGGETAGGGEGDFKAAIVTDTAGLGDQSFNDSANRGLQQAGSELGIETQVYLAISQFLEHFGESAFLATEQVSGDTMMFAR